MTVAPQALQACLRLLAPQTWEMGFVWVRGDAGGSLRPHGSWVLCLVPCEEMPGTGSERRWERMRESTGGEWLWVADGGNGRASGN